jgi:hypothetical protein
MSKNPNHKPRPAFRLHPRTATLLLALAIGTAAQVEIIPLARISQMR